MKKLISILITVAVLTMGLMIVAAPSAGALTQVDFVDMGNTTSEAVHNLVGWGPIEPDTHPGTWGSIATDPLSPDKKCRVTWSSYEAEGTNAPPWATFTLDTGSGMIATALGLRVLDGAGNDTFEVYVNDIWVYHYDDFYSTETWVTHPIDISGLNATGTLTVKIQALAPKWASWGTWGQLGVDWAGLVAEEAPPTTTPTPTPAGTEEGTGNTSKCFIATAAYGSYLDSHVDTLRDFRDAYLETNPVGSSLVSLYYRTSPPIAKFIDANPAVKPVVRAALMPAVAMSEVALNTTLAQKIAILAGIALVSLALIVCLRRWAFKRG